MGLTGAVILSDLAKLTELTVSPDIELTAQDLSRFDDLAGLALAARRR